MASEGQEVNKRASLGTLFAPFTSSGKGKWPELVGRNGEEAAAIIKRENNNVNPIVLKEGSAITSDIKFNRVWVWVDDNGVVLETPTIG